MNEIPFRKADLHIHTPVSDCYKDSSAGPGAIVDAALSAGLEIIAVTDHNSFEAVEEIAVIGRQNGLYVFPGVEISTSSGHFTGIFDIGTARSQLNHLLDNLGIDSGHRGDGTFINSHDIFEVLKGIVEMGGIAVAAHIERWPSGFLESNQTRKTKMAIHASEYLSALEITIPGDRERWNSGLTRNFPKKYACIQSSDAHSLDEIGRRSVYIGMNKINLESLRDVFNNREGRISFPDE